LHVFSKSFSGNPLANRGQIPVFINRIAFFGKGAPSGIALVPKQRFEMFAFFDAVAGLLEPHQLMKIAGFAFFKIQRFGNPGDAVFGEIPLPVNKLLQHTLRFESGSQGETAIGKPLDGALEIRIHIPKILSVAEIVENRGFLFFCGHKRLNREFGSP